MAIALPDDLPVKLFRTPTAFAKWIATRAAAKGAWLQIAKKGAGVTSVTYAEALDVAWCHGWIDGQKRAMDAQYFLQRFTPRRPKGLWSKINIGHVERLIASGEMQPSGLREVDAAKQDGRWDAAYEGAATMDVPPELVAALRDDAAAKAFFEALDRTNRYAACWRVQTAKSPATRDARVEKLVAMLARGEKIHRG